MEEGAFASVCVYIFNSVTLVSSIPLKFTGYE